MHSYPKIYAIGHRYVQELFAGPVIVEEKVDGSQFNFGLVNGELEIRSRGTQLHVPCTEKMFSLGVQTVLELKDGLVEDWVYRCEYLQKPKHNALKYGRVPEKHIILFDVNHRVTEEYMNRGDKEQEADRLGLEIVPLLYEGEIHSAELVHDLIKGESILGGPMEGCVVKNYNRFGVDGKILIGKFVSESFKETHAKEWGAANPGIGDIIDRLIATLKCERRWEKAVERLRDAGKIEGSARDIGAIIKEVQQDITAEEKEFIAQKLTEFALPRILRASSSGVAQWYKDKLLKEFFPEGRADELSNSRS